MSGGRWPREDFDSEGGDSNLRDADPERIDHTFCTPGRLLRDRSNVDAQRSNFASGPAARDAAAMLQAALGLPASAMVSARFERYAIRRKNHHFSGREGS